MKRILGHVVTLVLCALGVSAAAPACVDNDQSLFIRNVLAPAQNRQNGACTYTDDPQQPGLFFGILDVGVTDSYNGVFLVGNQMIPRGDPLAARAESMRAHINGGIVRVTRADGTLIREFTSAATGFADPQNNNQADFGVFSLIAIDAPTSKILKDLLIAESRANNVDVTGLSIQVITNVKVFGKTLGGTDLESAEFQFPIRVCIGCRVSFPAGVNDSAQDPRANCLGTPAATGSGTEVVPCFFGQDEAVNCKRCLNREACRFAEKLDVTKL